MQYLSSRHEGIWSWRYNLLRSLAISLLERLGQKEVNNNTEARENEDQLNISTTSTFSDDLDEKLKNRFGRTQSENKTFNYIIRQEMALYVWATTSRLKNLENLYSSIQTIRPTSVEAERAFSAMGLFSTRLRTRLSDESLDALVFMRQHYLRAQAQSDWSIFFI